MSKTIFSKMKLSLVALLFAIVFVCVGSMMFAKAESSITTLYDVTSFKMESADLIVEGDEGINGLNFTASISADEFGAINALVGEGKTYTSIETGLIILPAYFTMDESLGFPSESTLFGEGAVYGWSEYADGEWQEYTGDKVQIININANNWVDVGDKYTYSGAIVNLHDHNETVAFFSIAYVRAFDSYGNAYYASTDMRGSYLTASVAMELEEEYAGMDADQKAWVDANWTRWEARKGDDLLIDVNGRESIGAMEFVGDVMMDAGAMAEFGMLELTAMNVTKGDVVIEVDMETGEEPAIPVGDLDEGIWTLNMYSNGILVYTRDIDIYNSTAKPVWNTVDDLDVDALYRFKADLNKEGTNTEDVKLYARDTMGEVITVERDGVEVSALKLDSDQYTSGPGHLWISVAPMHTKPYYETLVGRDLSLTLSVYFDVDEGVSGYNQFFIKQSKVADESAISGWFDVSFTIEELLNNWDTIVDITGQSYSWGARQNYGMFYAYNPKNGTSGNNAIYLAGMEISMDVSDINLAGGEILVDVDEVADKTALDLTSYMKAEDVEQIAFVESVNNVTYELKGYSIADTIAVNDLTAVDVSSAQHAAYILKVRSGFQVIYTATIDLYSKDDAVVWADTLTAENVLVHSGGYTTGRATPAAAKAFEIIDASTVTEETDPLYGKTGTFAKTVSTTSENVIVSVLSLHSKAYYKEMVGNQNYVLTIDKYVAGSYNKSTNPGGSLISGIGMQGTDNYGRWSTWSNYRGGNGTMNKWGEKAGIGVYMSLDNYLLRSEDDPCYFTGAWYDFYKLHSKSAKQYNMMQFEVSAASEAEPLTIYFSGAKIVEASETLLSASGLASSTASSEYAGLTLEYDFANEKKVDLTTVFDANNLAKYKVYASKYISSSYFKWTITFSDSTTAEVKPLADGTTELDLDALASDGATVHSKLLANAKVKIVATSPSQPYPQPTNIAIFNATFKNLPEIPVEEPALDLSAYNMTEEKFSIYPDNGTIDFTANISAENAAKLEEIKAAGYELTYVLGIDGNNTLVLTEAEAKIANDNSCVRWQDDTVTYSLTIKVVDGSTEYVVLTGSFVAVFE